MTSRIQQTTNDLSLRFGLGVNSVASDEQVDDGECVSGQNVLLTHDNSTFTPRPPFDLLGTAPNGQPIRGFVTLRDANGVVTMLVQAGSVVYEWDGGVSTSGFTVVSNDTTLPTISSTSRLRGRLGHYWALDDLVIITDLALETPLLTWDGSTLSRPTMLRDNGTAFGAFYSKYCVVRDERAFYGSVRDSTPTTLTHMLVVSGLENYLKVSSNTAPSGAASPSFILSPDLRPINGLTEAFGLLALSTEFGSMWKLTGADAEDFALEGLFQGSGASGEESVAYVGNDVAFGRQGRAESLIAVDTFGDVSTDDLTRHIADQVEGVDEWTVVYNSRNQRIYFLADGGPALWVYHKALDAPATRDGLKASKWMRWQTNHSLAFQPTAMMNCLDPVDGLEYVFMGDDRGNLYRLEGTYDSGGDGGTVPVVAERLSRLYQGPLDAESFGFDGWVRARSSQTARLDVTLEYVGEAGFTRDTRTLNIRDPFGDTAFYGGTIGVDAAYYGGTEEDGDASYYSQLGRGPFSRYKIAFAGGGYDLQIRARITGDTQATLSEVGLRHRFAK